jgi:hypothetical protein
MADYTQFVRCRTCQRAYEKSDIVRKQMWSCRCGGRQMSNTILTRKEAFFYLLTHPCVALHTAYDSILGGLR